MKKSLRTSVLKKFISFLISLQIALVPGLLHASSTGLVSLEEANKLTNTSHMGGLVKSLNDMGEVIASKDFGKLSHDYINLMEMTGQKVFTYDIDGKIERQHSLINQSQLPKDAPAANEFVFKIENGRLVLFGYQDGVLVAKQAFTSSESRATRFVGVTQGDRIASMLTKDGRVLAVDMSLVAQLAFKANVPLFTVAKSKYRFNAESEVKLTRIQPSTEVPQIDMDHERDRQSSKKVAQMEQGGIIISWTNKSGKRVAQQVTAQRLFSQVATGMGYLAGLAVQFSQQGWVPTFNERVQKYLEIDEVRKTTLLEQLVQTIERNSSGLSKADAWIQGKIKSLYKSPNAQNLLQTMPRQNIDALLDTSEGLRNYQKVEKGQLSMAEWKNLHQKATEKALSEIEYLKKEVREVKSKDLKRQIINKVKALKLQIREKDFNSKDFVELIRASAKEERAFEYSNAVSGWKKFITPKVITTISLVGLSLVSYGAFLKVAPEVLSRNIEVSQQVYLATSWVYNSIPSLFRNLEYMRMLSIGVLSSLAIIPGLHITFSALPWGMRGAGYLRGGESNPKGKSLIEASKRWAEMSVWQRVSTATVQSLAKISPMVRIISNLSNQRFSQSMGKGIVPWKIIKKDSSLGQELGLKKNTMVGFNSIFANKEHHKTQGQIVDKLAAKKQLAETLAWKIAGEVMGGGNALQEAKRGASDSQFLQAKKMVARKIEKMILQKLESKEKGFEKRVAKKAFVFASEVKELQKQGTVEKGFYKEILKGFPLLSPSTKRKLSRIVRARLKMTMLNAKEGVPRFGKNVMKTTGNLGVALADFFNSIKYPDMLASRVKQEFISDHIVVTKESALIGPLADPSNPKMLYAQKDGFLYTHPYQHFMIGLNTINHLLVAAARRVLVFYKAEQVVDVKDLPVEKLLLRSSLAPQTFGSGLASWGKSFNPTKSNIGAYFTRDILKRFEMAHIQGLFMVSGMLTLAYLMEGQEVSLSAAILKSAILITSAIWAYGAIWTMLTKFSGMVQGQANVNRAELEELVRRLNTASKNKNISEVQRLEAKILSLYSKNGAGAVNVYRKMVELEKLSNPRKLDRVLKKIRGQSLIKRSFKKKLKKAFKEGPLKVVAQDVHQLIKALESGDQERALKYRDKISNTFEKNALNTEFKKGLDVLEQARKVGDLALKAPPVYTQHNSSLESFLTWTVGAIGTTYLGNLFVVGVLGDSITTLKATTTIAVSLLLYPIVYKAFGRKTWVGMSSKVSRQKRRMKARKRLFFEKRKSRVSSNRCSQFLMSM